MNKEIKQEMDVGVTKDEPPDANSNIFSSRINRVVACVKAYSGLCESRKRFTTDASFCGEFSRTYRASKFY